MLPPDAKELTNLTMVKGFPLCPGCSSMCVPDLCPSADETAVHVGFKCPDCNGFIGIVNMPFWAFILLTACTMKDNEIWEDYANQADVETLILNAVLGDHK